MVYKSLFLSAGLTFFLGYALTAGLTNPNSPLKKLPEWSAIPMLVIVFALYVLAGWWAIRGFGGHKIAALFSLGFCTLGIGLYIAGFLMEIGNGKAMPGQFDYDFSRLDPAEKEALMQITQNAGLGLEDATFTEFWRLSEPAPGFRICVQKGHVTALHFSGKKIPDLAPFSRFPQLGALYLNNCGLSDMSALRAERLDRLELADNQITDIKTLRGVPQVGWLDLRNNQLQSEEGIEMFSKLVSKDLSGNPFTQ